MTTHLLNRLFSASSKPFLIALVAFGTGTVAQAQTQDFASAAAQNSGVTFTASAPGSFYQPNGTTGFGAYGVTGATTTIDFAERVIPFGTPAGSIISFDVANPVGVFNATSSIQVLISIDRAAYASQLTIGASGSSSAYNFGASFPNGSNNVAINYTGTNSTLAVGSAGQRPITSITINALPAASANAGKRVSVRIILTAAANSTLLIDNLSLTTNGTTPLPVELTRFDAAAKGTGVALSWATASEKNSAYFEVQRSATGEAYETIGKVTAQGNSTSLREYAYADSRPLVGRAYYRLRQVDADGSSAYSPVASVRADGLAEAQPYPNPSTDALTLPASLGAVQYRIFNPLGQTLLQGQAAGNERLDVRTLPKGPFFLELSDATGRHTQRLVKE